MRVSPYPRALSEMDAPSLPSIGLRSCQSGSLALNTVLLSGSLSAETAVILAARSSSNQGRKEDAHDEEKRVFTAFKTPFRRLSPLGCYLTIHFKKFGMIPSSIQGPPVLSSDTVVRKWDVCLTSLNSHFLQTKKAFE